MKQFKSKKIKKKKNIFIILFTFFFFFSYVFMIKYCLNNKFKKNLLSEDYNYINFNLGELTLKKIKEDINKPVTLLNNNVKNAIEVESKKTSVSNKNKENSEEKNDVVNKPNEVILSKDEKTSPIVYIYNTHQTEQYVDYSVYEVSKVLSDKLTSNGIISYFEEQSVSVFLQNNNLKYYKSYTASRKYLNEAKEKYPTINYFFDIHRDSVSKEKSTITYNGKNYAKVLFVVGTDNPNNESNKNNAIKLNEIIKSKVPNISRDIAYHGGDGYNGVYNQDLSSNLFLIEIGGKDNSKEEVLNTMNIIYESICEYIRGVL